MDRKVQTAEALNKIVEFRTQLSSFTKSCNTLLTEITNDEFLSENVAADVLNTLNGIMDAQRYLSAVYNSLFKGIIPDKVSEVADNLQQLDIELSQKEAYYTAVAFFNSLHCKQDDSEKMLTEYRAELSAVNLDTITLDEAKDRLQKYVDFKKFYDGQQELFLATVAASFDSKLVLNVIRYKHEFYCKEEAKVVVTASPTSIATGNKDVDKAEAVKVEDNEKLNKADRQNVTVAKKTDTAEMIKQRQENITENGGKKLLEPKQAISESMLHNVVVNSNVIVDTSKEKKPITSAIAKRDQEKYCTCGFDPKIINMLICSPFVDANVIIASNFVYTSNKEAQAINYLNTLEYCQRIGYVAKYDCGSYGSFYMMTERAVKLVQLAHIRKDAVAKKRFQDVGDEREKANKIIKNNNYGLILLGLATNEALIGINGINCFSKEIYNYGASLGYIIADKTICTLKKNITFVLVNSDKKDVYIELFNAISKKASHRTAKTWFFIDFSQEHAKALINWLNSCVGSWFAKTAKYYYILDEKKVRNFVDDSEIIDIAELAEAADNDIQTAANENQKAAGKAVEHEKQELASVKVAAVQSVVPIEATDKQVLVKEREDDDQELESQNTTAHNVVNSVHTRNIEQTQEYTVAKETDASAKVISVKADELTAKYKKILMTGKVYAAVAYMKKLAEINATFTNEYKQLAYAVNDPTAGCVYTSDQIINVYLSGENGYNSYYLVAAMLRNYYYNQCKYDHSLDVLMAYAESDKLLSTNIELKQLLNLFSSFKKEYFTGMSRYADYKNNSKELTEKLTALAVKAKDLQRLAFDSIRKTGINNLRLTNTLDFLFNENSELNGYLNAVLNKDIDNDTLELVRQYVAEVFIRDASALSAENVKRDKIEILIDNAWNEAGNKIKNRKVTAKLIGAAREKLVHRLENIAGLLCDFIDCVECIQTADTENSSYPAYQKASKKALSSLKSLIKSFEEKREDSSGDYANKIVLLAALKECRDRIEGAKHTYIGKYFYLPFLSDDNVLLADNCRPIYRDIAELPAVSSFSRIERHAFADTACYEAINARIDGISNGDKQIIQNVVNEDNYGSLELLLEYIHDTNPDFSIEDFKKENKIEIAVSNAYKSTNDTFKTFKDDLELCQSYGQIDNTEENVKEIILQTTELLWENAVIDKNYGYFKKVLTAFKNKIQQDAKVNGDNLKYNFDLFLDSHKDLVNDTAAVAVVKLIQQYIDKQRYSSAEELLNRLENDDYTELNGFETEDYLEDFLSHYEICLSNVNIADKPLQYQVRISKVQSKESRGAERLLNAWPKGNTDAKEEKAKKLLTALGFNVGTIKKLDNINKLVNFDVKLQEAENGRKNNYNHPVPAFGSLAEVDGFRVVYIFGSYDAERLLEIFNTIGDEKHTLIILDSALKESVRRRLALLVKNKANGCIFAVLDRVVVKYLIDNYNEQTVNKKLLSIIIPYAYYQPYCAESSKPMPSELFIGRKDELKKIKDINGVNIVYGGRQLGKSALLMMAKKDVDKNESGDRAVYVDIKGLNYVDAAQKISEELVMADILDESQISNDWGRLAFGIKQSLRNEAKPIHYLLLLLDEADTFINSCKDVHYKPFEALKDIQSSGSGNFKFVVAGLRDVVRFDHAAALNDNSVLPQLSSLTVKPFKYAEAKELLEYPLSYLGFRFRDDVETDTLVAAILGQTNSFPGMIQLYCTKLIEAMKSGYANYKEANTPPYNISEEHIKKILGEKHLQDEIRQKFYITLKVGGDDYYLLIAMITAYIYNTEEACSSVTPEAVLEVGRDLAIKKISNLTIENVASLMEEMRELNVLQHNGERGYRFTRFSFFQMMGTKADLEEKLIAYMGDTENE